jgi:4'-phosphopantetheinyl transferase
MIDTETIEIWRVPLDESQLDQHGAWRGVLSSEEQLRADTFHADAHRREYVIAHVALRTVLGRRLGVAPAEVQFAEGSFAGNGMHGKAAGRIKPALRFAGTSSSPDREPVSGPSLDIRFNLSHTRGAALVGVALGRELGVDIERQRPMEDLEAIARSVMSSKEWEGWLAIPRELQERAFYRLWTRKEAYLKAIGLGLYRNLQEVTVPATAESLETGKVHLVQDRAGAGDWQVIDIEAGPGYAAGISLEGAGAARLVIRDLSLMNLG